MTAAMLVGLTAFSAFVVDYGILWLARRQIQNAADAAALAAATSLGFDVPGDLARAQANARTAAAQNLVWGVAPTVTDADITFPLPCPAGGLGVGPCVRVDAFRNQARGSALPTIFGQLVGVRDQGVKATATAQVIYGDHTECVRPLAIPDKWQELNPAPLAWTELQTFDRYNAMVLKAPADVYVPPTIGGIGANGTGFSRTVDYGLTVHLRPAEFPLLPATKAGNERFLPVRTSATSSGAAGFLTDLTTCSPMTVRPGDVLTVEPTYVPVETQQGVDTLMTLDPDARWDPSLNGGLGGVAGGCMASGACVVSPRIMLLPAFDPDAWDLAMPAGTSVVVTRLVGVFIEYMAGGIIGGRYMIYPEVPSSSMVSDPASSFLVGVTLVR